MFSIVRAMLRIVTNWRICNLSLLALKKGYHSYPKWEYKIKNVSEVWCIFLKSKFYDNSKKHFSKILGLAPSPINPIIFWKKHPRKKYEIVDPKDIIPRISREKSWLWRSLADKIMQTNWIDSPHIFKILYIFTLHFWNSSLYFVSEMNNINNFYILSLRNLF